MFDPPASATWARRSARIAAAWSAVDAVRVAQDALRNLIDTAT